MKGAVVIDRIFGVGNRSHAVGHSGGADEANDEVHNAGDLR